MAFWVMILGYNWKVEGAISSKNKMYCFTYTQLWFFWDLRKPCINAVISQSKHLEVKYQRFLKLALMILLGFPMSQKNQLPPSVTINIGAKHTCTKSVKWFKYISKCPLFWTNFHSRNTRPEVKEVDTKMVTLYYP